MEDYEIQYKSLSAADADMQQDLLKQLKEKEITPDVFQKRLISISAQFYKGMREIMKGEEDVAQLNQPK